MSQTQRGNPIQRLPLPLFFVVIAAFWIGLRIVLRTGSLTPAYVVGDVVGGLVFASALTFVVARRRRRLGGTDASVVFMRALRTGTVPADTDTSRWSTELDRTERVLRRQRWSVPLVAVLPVALGVWVAATYSGSRALGLVLVLVFVVLVLVVIVAGRRQLARIAKLRAQV